MDLISARWRPQTFSSAREISPTVAFARAASTAARALLERKKNLAAGRFCPRGVAGGREEISVARRRGGRESVEPRRDRRLVALGAQTLQLVDLQGTDLAVLDLEDLDRRLVR